MSFKFVQFCICRYTNNCIWVPNIFYMITMIGYRNASIVVYHLSGRYIMYEVNVLYVLSGIYSIKSMRTVKTWNKKLVFKNRLYLEK